MKSLFEGEKYENNHNILDEGKYYIKIDYPDIENKRENAKIARSIKNYIDEKKKEFVEVADKEDKNDTYEFMVTNSVYEYEDFTSIHLQIYSYVGGAHYIREDKSYYFRTRTGEELHLNNFLVDEYALGKLAELSVDYIEKYFEEKQIDLSSNMVEEGTKPIFENYTHFTFRQDGLEILFPPYQVASWADGEIRITIPYKELKGIVKDEYLKIVEEPLKNVTKKERNIEDFRGKKLIAFTFDDGPSNGPTNRLLDNLDRFDARVTFFVLGSRVNQYRNSLSRAYEEGNQIGSHTYGHLNLKKLGDADILREVDNANREIQNVIGVSPTLLRPPYGNTNSKIKSLTDMYTILWDIDTEDWKYKDPEVIAQNIIDNAHDGAIVLMHDIYETSIDGAILAMEKLEEEGYAFVTIEEMMILKNVEPDKAKSYFKF